MSQKTSKELIQKLIAVSAAIPAIEKRGYNSFHNYSYAMEADILHAVRQQLIAQGLFVITSVKNHNSQWLDSPPDKNGNSKRTCLSTVTLSHTITDGVDEIQVDSIGTGMDNQDKSIYKALTGAMKYFLSKNFMIPTDDDPEAFTPEGGQTHQELPKMATTKKVKDKPKSNGPVVATSSVPEEKNATSKSNGSVVAPSATAFVKFINKIAEERKRIADDDLFNTVCQQVLGPNMKYEDINPDNVFVQEALFWQLKAVAPDEEFNKKHSKEEIEKKAAEAIKKAWGDEHGTPKNE